MLNFHRVTSVNNPIFLNMYNLYTLSFPPEERRSWGGLEYELMYEKCFSANALVKDEKFVGLFNYWVFERFYYIEHIAILPSQCGKHIGTDAMKTFLEQAKLPVVLEVELPDTPVAIRRIAFYERLGFRVLSCNYAQPPYEDGGFVVPMQLMSNDVHFAETHFHQLRNTLYDKVYHYDGDHAEPQKRF